MLKDGTFVANFNKYTKKEAYDNFINEYWNDELSSKFKKPKPDDLKEMQRVYVRYVGRMDSCYKYRGGYYTISTSGGSGAIKIWKMELKRICNKTK